MIRIDTKKDATELAKLLLDPTLTTAEALHQYRALSRANDSPLPPYRDESDRGRDDFWEYGSEDR